MCKILAFIAFFLILTWADPVPTGGANCTNDSDCNGENGGECDIDFYNNTGTCVCPNTLADVDCSYHRYSADVAGGLNIGLSFIGVCGIGNFVIENTGHAVGQLILGLTLWYLTIPLYCGFCLCGKNSPGPLVIGGGVLLGVAKLAGLAGFIWSIVTGALMIQGSITDGNGFDLYH